MKSRENCNKNSKTQIYTHTHTHNIQCSKGAHAAKVSTAKVKKATKNFRRRRRLVVHIVLSCRHHLLRHWGKPTAHSPTPPHKQPIWAIRRRAEIRVGVAQYLALFNSVCQKTARLLLNRVKLCQQHKQQHLLSELSPGSLA